MTGISASMGLYKVVLPILWFVIVGFLAFNAGSMSPTLPTLLITGTMAAAGVFVFKKLVWDVADEVLDAGDHLVFRKGDKAQHVRLADITNVHHQYLSAPERVTVQVGLPGPLGTELVFCLPPRLNPFPRSPIVADLVRRVDEARRAAPKGP